MKCVTPEEVGFCPTRLARLGEVIKQQVESGIIPGAVVLLARFGKPVIFESFGYCDPAREVPMRRDSLFRLASLTKPITSVAAMILVERGMLSLDEPVARYLPEFDGLCCRSSAATPPIKVHDLLRHTSGFTYGDFGSGPIHESYRRLNVLDPQQTSSDLVEKLARIDLLYVPGSTFEYGMSTDVLGLIIERLLARDLQGALHDLVLAPMGLDDTGFLLSSRSQSRLAQPFRDQASGRMPWMPAFWESNVSPSWYSGGGGLLSSAHNYYAFLQTLLDDLVHDQGVLLSRATASWMVANHLPAQVNFGAYMPSLGALAPLPELGQGFGLGFLIRTHRGLNSLPGSVGDFSWAGISGTYAWVDPAEEMVCVFMMQAPDQRHHCRRLLRQLVYQALRGGKNL
ncbi:serine hydrolase [Bradyrhizobium liaoningense]|uniref:serine hydrolase domain-containing protein n=1 Tax=Bradyrhizobium liaoningense TaxID=43992 RepID=UPI001BAD8BEC|nr:serine hydrolase domain-containing protein [Bradyrhizobium liaoningense]MBR0713940.1 beta-lactamase family protein [Bradyrhizobium liaoningense]